MPQITDVSPTAATKTGSTNHSVTGRMLSIACAPDGSVIFMGSYSNLWVSRDGGQNWTQLNWPQPAAGQYTATGALGGWCAVDIAVGFDANHQLIVLVLMAFDRAINSRGIWRSADGGATWTHIHQFNTTSNVGQLEWANGSNNLVYAAGGTALAISKDAGVTFSEALPFGAGSTKSVNHIAVWQNAPADSAPSVIYVLGSYSPSPGVNSGCMALSFDGGVSWIQDQAALPSSIGGATDPTANSNSAKVMAISPLSPRQVYITANGSDPQLPAVYLFDYSHFPSVQTSTHQTLPLSSILTGASQDSGNVFVVTTQPGRGNLLFYGAQRSVCYVHSLNPSTNSAFYWVALDSHVHVDLHGLLLSPDFAATLTLSPTLLNEQAISYSAKSGTVLLLSDGGIYRSTNGGNTFVPGQGAHTLSTVNLAGAAIPGSGPVLSLNTGDNDGFYSLDGGQTWSNQQYGGGDNDCSFADPMRPYSMFVATPRWDGSGDFSTAASGQTVTIYEASPGKLPNASASGTSPRHVVQGPLPIPDPTPTHPKNTVPGWNADSTFYLRGSNPIVLSLSSEQNSAQGDYVFILNPVLKPVLVRSQSIFNISNRNEWQTTATEPVPGANVFLQGPPLPRPNLGVVQASGGHTGTIFYVGGDGTLLSWTEGFTAWKAIVPAAASSNSAGVSLATRFFVSPYLPTLIYVQDMNDIRRSDDGGQTWVVDSALTTQLTWNRALAFQSSDGSGYVGENFEIVLTDMKFDPNNPLVRFAVGTGGAFYTIDGTNWSRLLHSGAFPCSPINCFYDSITSPSDPALYVGTAGRGVVKIDGFAIPATQASVLPTALVYPTQQVSTTSLQQTVTVFAGSATITGISFVDETAGAAADFRSVPPPGGRFSLQNGQLVITVWFVPTAGGVRKAKLEIAHNQAGSPLVVELSGTGNAAPAPLLSASPGSLSFTPKKVTNHTVTLTNTGTAPLTISNINIDQPNFHFTTSCGASPSVLNPGQKCTITVSYTFVGPGGSANLIITHDAVGSPMLIDLDASSASGINP